MSVGAGGGMSARSAMRHRAMVMRDGNLGTRDAHNNPLPPDYREHIAECPCYVWQKQAEGLIEDRHNVIVYLWMMMAPLGTDINERDRIDQVTMRDDETITTDTLFVEQVMRRKDHLLITLRAET